MTKIQSLILGLFIFLAACSPGRPQDVSSLPTVAQLPTQTATLVETATSTALPTATMTDTVTATTTLSLTPTVTPSATITDTPTPTATNTPLPSDTPVPTSDNEAVLSLVQLAEQATILPQQMVSSLPTAPPTGAPGVIVAPPLPTSCAYPPSGGFATVYAGDPTLNSLIGCPVGAPPGVSSFSSALQLYEHGQMFWLQGPSPYIYALFSTGRFQRYDDTYNQATDPISGGETPPLGLKEPVRGFGKVWRSFGEVRTGLGWAVNDEAGGQATIQFFDRGEMIYLTQPGAIYILVNDPGGVTGSWRSVPGSF